MSSILEQSQNSKSSKSEIPKDTFQFKVKCLNLNTLQKTMDEQKIKSNSNMIMSHILEAFSKTKHTLNPDFLALFFLILRIKRAVCYEQNSQHCFCHGCLLARRYRVLLQQNAGEADKVIRFYECNEKLKVKFTDIDKLLHFESQQLEVQKQIENLNLFMQDKLSQQQSSQNNNEEMSKFLSLILLTQNVRLISCTPNLQEEMLYFLNSIKSAITQANHLLIYGELKKLFR